MNGGPVPFAVGEWVGDKWVVDDDPRATANRKKWEGKGKTEFGKAFYEHLINNVSGLVACPTPQPMSDEEFVVCAYAPQLIKEFMEKKGQEPTVIYSADLLFTDEELAVMQKQEDDDGPEWRDYLKRHNNSIDSRDFDDPFWQTHVIGPELLGGPLFGAQYTSPEMVRAKEEEADIAAFRRYKAYMEADVDNNTFAKLYAGIILGAMTSVPDPKAAQVLRDLKKPKKKPWDKKKK